VNVDEEKSPELPVAVIVYTPAGTLATTKLKPTAIVPPAIVQLVGLPTGPPDNEHVVSVEENPEPATKTVDPT
jgi:hypothetical protein